MPITVRDKVGTPQLWAPEPCPDLPAEPWDDAPWTQRCDTWPVDAERTRSLIDVTVPIDCHPPLKVWEGSVTGMPYQLVGKATTTVWDLARPITWQWFTPTLPTVQVPLPDVVRREGDPGAAWDRHAYLIDPGAALWEMIQLDRSPVNRWRTFGQTEWTAGYNGGGPGIARWDLRRPWDAAGQPRGVVAAAVPHMPHFVRADEIARGRIDHALFLALANYAPGRTGYARGSDGTAAGHPCRAGERLRLPAERVAWFEPGTPERTVAEALARYGCIVGDRTDHSGSATSKPGVLATAQDPRISAVWTGLGLRLSDFDIVHT